VFNWSFQRKLTISLVLVCVLAVVTSVGALVTYRVLIASLSQADGGAAADLADARAIQLSGVRNIASVHASLLSGGSRSARMAQAGSAQVHDQAERLRAHITDPTGRALLDSVLVAESAHQAAFLHALAAPEGARDAVRPSFPAAVLAQSERLDHALTAFADHFEGVRLRSHASSRSGMKRAEGVLVSLSVVTLVPLPLVCVLLLTLLDRSYRNDSKFTPRVPVPATPRVTPRETDVPVRRRHVACDALVDVRPDRLDGLRVLVVDDESSSSEALTVLFGSCGANARVAGSAGEALAMFDSWQPDILVSDIAMPGEDGYSLIRKIRRRGPQRGGSTPAVALTARAKIEDRVSILHAGFQMYLSKPADPTELVAVIGRLARERERVQPISQS